MNSALYRFPAVAPVGRRRFIQGAAAVGALTALNVGRNSLAQPNLSGTNFDLTIGETPINITGKKTIATGINGGVPGPILHWREGDTVTLNVTNKLDAPSSIHWHGIRSPAAMDGVPGLSFAGIEPGQTFTYRIPIHQSGTYWYHSHSGLQEQTGVYGAIVIAPKDGYADKFDSDHVVLLSDWSDEDPETIVSNLKFQSDYYNFNQRTVGTFFADASKNGLKKTIADRMMWGKMRMSPTDILDVTGSVYTYLMNGQAPGANWSALFRPGERMRLRFINGSAMTIFDVRIPGLKMTVIQADGNDVVPVPVDEFRIGVAETYDVIVEPSDAAYTIFAQSMDRTGFARGTLAPHEGMSAAVPPMDPRPMRTMTDMGMGNMDMGDMDMSSMDTGSGAKGQGQMSGMKMDGMAGMDNKAMAGMEMAPAPKSQKEMPGMKMDGMTDMDHGQKGGMDMRSMPGMKMGQGDMAGMPGMSDNGSGGGNSNLNRSVEVDNVAMAPTDRLSEPGIGLDGEKRKVLTYTDLRARVRGDDPRPPSREITLHLTGNMMRFIWGFDGKKFSEAEPIRLKLNERVRFTLINDTMMEHPIHLHGLWSELENGQGEYRPYKHTVTVKAGEKISYLVTADEPGMWAYHCHLLYHMETGMMRTVVVA
jgi:CopA family copper-resistance protein